MAEKKGDVYLLNGMKHFITNAPIADVFIVIAVTDPEKGPKGGISAFIVEKDFPGISIGNVHQSMGMQGSHKSELIFKNTPVPAQNLIGTEGRGLTVALKTVDEGRMGVAATSVGMATRLLDMRLPKSPMVSPLQGTSLLNGFWPTWPQNSTPPEPCSIKQLRKWTERKMLSWKWPCANSTDLRWWAGSLKKQWRFSEKTGAFLKTWWNGFYGMQGFYGSSKGLRKFTALSLDVNCSQASGPHKEKETKP
jgi:hypothetical protein